MSAVQAQARERVLDELRGGERFVLVTHENPDGDALGSLVAMHGVLRALGKDSVMFMAEETRIVNIDHHHDNTRFGTVNHVVPDASCTAEIVWDLMRELGVQASTEIA